jgi:ferrous iron transport protein B
VVDATNLERNLYLTVQVLETEIPVILALNMTDLAKAKKLCIQTDKLSQALNVPVVRTVARDGDGLDKLLEAIIQTSSKNGK